MLARIKYVKYEAISNVETAYKIMRDFASFLKNFDRIYSIERKSKSNVNAVPIKSMNESEVIWNNGPALNETASAIPRIIILNVQLPIMSP